MANPSLHPWLIPSTAAAVYGGDSTPSLTDIPPDILQTHILTRLDGPSLAASAVTSSQIFRLATAQNIWSDICRKTWPSTDTPRLLAVISSFSNGPRSFFSDSFPLFPDSKISTSAGNQKLNIAVPELISAVDIYYRGNPIFSKTVETEMVSGWFRCSPFRIDMLDPKDVIPTPIRFPKGEESCRELAEEFTLSWIIINPNGRRRAMNISSFKPVSVQRHWLSGEVHVRFTCILAGDKGTASEHVQCGIMFTCGGSEGGELQVREVNLQVEDMDGSYLNGKDSLVILRKAMEGKKGRIGREIFLEFLEKKKERRERKLRNEGTLDMMCMAFGLFCFASLCIFLLLR